MYSVSLLIFGLLNQVSVEVPFIAGYNPPTADDWIQSVTFKCRGATLTISGYGPVQPPDRPVHITLDGKPLRGEGIEKLRRDLSVGSAVYRLGAKCPKEPLSFYLFIDIGEKTQAGDMVYRKDAAFISEGKLMAYRIGKSDADNFWFR